MMIAVRVYLLLEDIDTVFHWDDLHSSTSTTSYSTQKIEAKSRLNIDK